MFWSPAATLNRFRAAQSEGFSNSVSQNQTSQAIRGYTNRGNTILWIKITQDVERRRAVEKQTWNGVCEGRRLIRGSVFPSGKEEWDVDQIT